MTTTAVPASDKQTAFIVKLLGEKNTDHFGEDTLADLIDFRKTGTLPRKHASQLIDALLSAPKKQQADAPALTEGVYIAPDQTIVKVKASKAGNVYAQTMVDISGERLTMTGEIVKWRWEYSKGLVSHLRPEWKMDAETAHAFGLKVGKCLWCGRKLVAAESVSKSLGPVCSKRFA